MWTGVKIIVLLILVWFIGFVLGKYLGRREGFELGKALSPLELRRQTLLQGVCLVCGRPAPGGSGEGNGTSDTEPIADEHGGRSETADSEGPDENSETTRTG